MEDQEDFDAACWAEQESQERRRRNEEALARLRPIAAQFRQECEQWEREFAARDPFRREAI